MIELFTFGFVQRALLVSVIVGISTALLGVFLVLRRYAMIGDGIGHISFAGIALGMVFKVMPFLSALIFAMVGAIGILKIKEKTRLHGDAAIAIITYTGLGVGILIASAVNGINADLLGFLFGSILTTTIEEVMIALGLAIAVIVLIVLFYRDLFAITFDEETARTQGMNSYFLNVLLVLLTAITIISLMRIVGLLLAGALIVMPPATALQMNMSFKKTLIFSAVIGAGVMFFGMLLSLFLNLAASGTIVSLGFLLFLSAYVWRKRTSVVHSGTE
ncbi:MAG: metal ABC transporter permease [Nanoarchaeota archaeon]